MVKSPTFSYATGVVGLRWEVFGGKKCVFLPMPRQQAKTAVDEVITRNETKIRGKKRGVDENRGLIPPNFFCRCRQLDGVSLSMRKITP